MSQRPRRAQLRPELPVGLRSAGRRPKTTRPRSRAGRVVSGVRSRPSRRRPSRRGPPLPLGTGSVGSCRWPAFPKSSRSQTAALGRSWPLSEVDERPLRELRSQLQQLGTHPHRTSSWV